jgi:hypothetical protein
LNDASGGQRAIALCNPFLVGAARHLHFVFLGEAEFLGSFAGDCD